MLCVGWQQNYFPPWKKRDERSDIQMFTHQAPFRIPIHQLANGHILTSTITTKQVLATKYASTNDIQLF